MKLLRNIIIFGLSGLALPCLINTAEAAMIQLTLSGNVTSSNMTAFPLNQSVTVSFTYDSTKTPQFTANQQGFFVDPFTEVSFASGAYGSSYSGHFGQINMYDNIGNSDGITFQFGSDQGYYQFTNPRPQIVPLASVLSNSVVQTFGEFRVNLGTSTNAIFNGFTLPVSYNLNDYNLNDFTANRSMLFGFSGGSFMTGIGSLSVQDVTLAPEPGTWLLPATSLAGLVLWRRFRSYSFS